MTTILETRYDTGGGRRCDAVCHRAKGTKCECVCGGRFHGIGDEAAENVTDRELNDARLEAALSPDETVQLRVGA